MDQVNGTRFCSEAEFTEDLSAINLSEDCYGASGVPLYVKDGVVYVDDGDTHTIVFGATGSKKTRLFVMPAVEICFKSGESFIVTDPKGEIYEKTSHRAAESGYELFCLDLRDFECGQSWNPFRLPYSYYHGGKRAKAIEMINEIASNIVGNGNSKDPFWDESATDILIGFILLLFERTAEMPKACNYGQLCVLWNQYKSNRKAFKMKLIMENRNTIIDNKLSVLDNASERTVGSIEAVVNTALNKLAVNEEFIEYISMDTVDLEALVKEKVAIYLVIPDENTSYHFLVTLFLAQVYEVLIREAQSRPNKKLERRMNFLIDEFANIPKINNMDAMITAARSRNIRFNLIVQGLAQLKTKYGENAELICGNCNNWLYLYSKEYDLLCKLSSLCGEVIYDTNLRVPLISPFELQHLNKEEGEALALVGRKMPFITRLLDIDDYPECHSLHWW